MKIAISATGTTLENDVDARFGRCSYFIIVDSETMEYEYIDNASSQAGGGAGVAAAINTRMAAESSWLHGGHCHQWPR